MLSGVAPDSPQARRYQRELPLDLRSLAQAISEHHVHKGGGEIANNER